MSLLAEQNLNTRIERTSRNVLTVRFDNIVSGWECWLLLRSDAHHDHKLCDRALEKRHLDMMVERNGYWADFGDLLDAMQGRYDPRRNYDEIRPEDVGVAYYDLVVSHAAEFYAPYADRCLLLTLGNHESAAERHTGHNLTSDLAYHLNTEALHDSNHRIHIGGFGGWIRFMFTFHKTKIRTVRLKYFHGAGTNAPVTKGVIQTARQQAYLRDADIVINGHNHQAYILPLVTEGLNRKGQVERGITWHGRIPGYLDSYQDGSGGWGVEKGHPPNPLGALWLRFSCEGQKIVHKLIPEIT